ncbi:MAG: POTRA domain-containing protein, partial [Pseudomonas sp.]
MKTKRLGLWVASCWLPMTVAVAQQPPQAGDSLRMLEERELTLPPPTEPVLEVPMPGPAAVPQSDIRIPVKQFRIEGNHSVATEELLAQLTDLTGQTLSLAQLYHAADRLTAYYRGEGYLVSRAYLPAQEIGEEGIITLAVAEGRYGKVTLENQSRLRDGIPHAMLHGLESGDAVTLKPLERRVLLLNDLPGTGASSSLSAGSEPGQSDLTVTLEDEPRFSGALTLDNHGNRHTGEYRLGA